MKKFTKLLSIISSILGVLTLTLGISLGVLDKPRTISNVSAVDVETAYYSSSSTIYETSIGTEGSGYYYDVVADVFINLKAEYNATTNLYDYSLTRFGYRSFVAIFWANTNRQSPLGSFRFFDSYNYTLYDDYLFSFEELINGGIDLQLHINQFGAGVDYFSEVQNLNLMYSLNFLGDEVFNSDFDDLYSFFVYYRASNTRYYDITDDIVVDFSLYYEPMYELGYNDGYSTGYSNGSTYGYNQGLTIGASNVINDPHTYNLYTESEYVTNGEYSYTQGFNAGISQGNDLNFYNFLKVLFHSPIDMFQGAFNFTLPLGNGQSLDILPLMTFLLTIAIALAVVKLILGGK